MQRTLTFSIAPLLAALLIISFAGIVRAQTSAEVDVEVKATTSGPLRLLNQKRLELKADIRTQYEETREGWKSASTTDERRGLLEDRKEFRENIKERLQVLVRTHIGSAIARLNAAIRHFERFTDRIESRITKLEERGMDTTSVEASLATAISLTATAKADVDALSTLVASVTAESDPETVKAEIRAAIQKAVESVKAAHKAFKETVRELAALVKASVEVEAEVDVNTEAEVDTE